MWTIQEIALSHLKSVTILTSHWSALTCLPFYAFAKNVWHSEKTIEESGSFSDISQQPAILKLELQRLYLDLDSRGYHFHSYSSIYA
jgi:hypothetical protein